MQQTSLLAKVGDSGAVIVGEHVITKDRIGNLRGVNQVHLQKSGLEMALLGFVFSNKKEVAG